MDTVRNREVLAGMTNNHNLLIGRVFRKSSAILTITFSVLFISNIVDGVIISCMLGAGSMAAFQLVSPVLMIILMANQIFIGGNKNLCAAKLGAGKIDEAQKFFASTLTSLILIGAACTFGVLFFTEQLADILGAYGDFWGVRSDVIGYLIGYAPGIIFLCITPALSDRVYLSGSQKIIIIPLIIQTLTDIAGNIISVEVFHAGMFGIGTATSLSYILSFLSMIIIERYAKPAFKFSVRYFSPSYTLKLFLNGLPESMSYCFMAIQNYVLNLILIKVGTSFDIAILSYIGLMANLLLPFMLSVNTSTFTLAGIFNEEHDRNSLANLLSVSLKDSFILNIVVAVAAFFIAPYAVRLLGLSPQENIIAVNAMRISLLTFPVRAVNGSIRKYFHGIGFMTITYIISFLEELIFICASAFVLSNYLGSLGVWISYPVCEILTLLSIAVCAVLRLIKFLPYTDKDKSGSENFVDYTASDIQDILQVSRDAEKFCVDNGASEQDAKHVSLAIEEFGCNVVRWGFGKSKRTIDIRLMKDDGWFLRLRDDCSAFNPKDWLAVHQEKDTEQNGIRLVCSLAKEINYFSVMGFNNLFVKF